MEVEVGTEIPAVAVDVRAEHMKVFSLLSFDPNPIHWDVAAVAAAGLGDRLVNQGGLNVAYVVNAAVAWAGGRERLRGFTVRFLGNVYADEVVTARGIVTGVSEESGGRVAELDVWLEREDGTKVVAGTATVALPAGDGS